MDKTLFNIPKPTADWTKITQAAYGKNTKDKEILEVGFFARIAASLSLPRKQVRRKQEIHK